MSVEFNYFYYFSSNQIIEAMAAFRELDRKQAFDDWMQQVDLEPNKNYKDLDLYLEELLEFIQPPMEKILKAKDRCIFFWLSVQVKYYSSSENNRR